MHLFKLSPFFCDLPVWVAHSAVWWPARAHWSEAEPSSNAFEFSVNVHTKSTHKHPSSFRFHAHTEVLGDCTSWHKKYTPPNSLLLSLQTTVKSHRDFSCEGVWRFIRCPLFWPPNTLLFLSTILSISSVMVDICWSHFHNLMLD